MSDDQVNRDAGADAQQEVLNANRTITIRKKRGATAIMPGGRRVLAAPYMHVRYDAQNEARVLGSPENMLTDDWKSEHGGWQYAWPIRMSDQTAAYLRAGWYVAVPYDALNSGDPMAAIAEVVTPGGRYIVWKAHLLVAIPPQFYQRMVTNYEHQAIARTVTNADSLEEMLDKQFGGGGFEAEVSPFTGEKVEPIA